MVKGKIGKPSKILKILWKWLYDEKTEVDYILQVDLQYANKLEFEKWRATRANVGGVGGVGGVLAWVAC